MLFRSVGAHAVMANGGVIAPVGLNMVALAAQRHAVPFVVLAGSHKVIYIVFNFPCWSCYQPNQFFLYMSTMLLSDKFQHGKFFIIIASQSSKF